MTTVNDIGEGFAGDFLEHYGVKGMKWGVRKRDKTPTAVVLKERPGKRVKAKGGKYQPPSEDAKVAATYKQQAKRSSTDSLSNKELQALVNRMNLEEQYNRLANSDVQLSVGAKFARNLVKETTPDSVVKGAGMVAGAAGIPFAPSAAKAITVGTVVAKAALGAKGGQSKKKK